VICALAFPFSTPIVAAKCLRVQLSATLSVARRSRQVNELDGGFKVERSAKTNSGSRLLAEWGPPAKETQKSPVTSRQSRRARSAKRLRFRNPPGPRTQEVMPWPTATLISSNGWNLFARKLPEPRSGKLTGFGPFECTRTMPTPADTCLTAALVNVVGAL